jgi:hypothetical protein
MNINYIEPKFIYNGEPEAIVSLKKYNWRTWSAAVPMAMVSMVVAAVHHLGALIIMVEVTFRGVMKLLASFWRNKKS